MAQVEGRAGRPELMALAEPARELLLALADDELLMGHRHSEWLGVAPFMEEDLAFATIAQDELGHARALYVLVGGDEAVDELAFGRPTEEYRSCWLAELPGRPWEQALVRHLLYDTAERVRWEALLGSSVPGLGDLAGKVMDEEEYHRRHAVPLFHRMVVGGPEARDRVRDELEALMPLARALFEPTVGEAQAVEEGVVAAPVAELERRWRGELESVLGAVAEETPWPDPIVPGGRRGVRSEHFAEALETMTTVFRLDPQARW